MFNDRLNNISNLVMTLQGQINNLRYSSMEMERRCADLRVLIQSELEVEKSEELLLEVSGNSKMCIVEDFSDKTAALVFDEMPHCLSNVFAAPESKSGLAENKTEGDFITENPGSQPFVIVTGDTKSEIERHKHCPLPLFMHTLRNMELLPYCSMKFLTIVERIGTV
ncbi:hypothetical protein K7X08_015159 [Anisodus acutangulus]|uniref:Uncharacterized protein n=1 Tax=Anisodus acutangulus TaxID=402998 RepID=A0A9Q1L392_9SOLA|nr:hypothetical protein K7X08_015159 [Anisodus acutangulus]